MPKAAKIFGGDRKQKTFGGAKLDSSGRPHRRWREEVLSRAEYICETPGCGRLAVIADHIIPHEGDKELKEDVSNGQALCELCNACKTAAESRARASGARTAGVEWRSTAEHLKAANTG